MLVSVAKPIEYIEYILMLWSGRVMYRSQVRELMALKKNIVKKMIVFMPSLF